MEETRIRDILPLFGYCFDREDISNLVESDRIRVRSGVIDMCNEWHLTY